MSSVEVVLEVGRTWTFASALDWPGWCRRGKGEEAALEELLACSDRYAEVMPAFRPGPLRVVGRLPGNATTDFGAPTAPAEGEEAAPTAQQLDALVRCWAALDAIVSAAPAELRKGPRGGGRDRDQVVAHVKEAERAYGRKVGASVPPRTPWPEQRQAILDALLMPGAVDWPRRYAVRRIAWHVLDHAWEIQDKAHHIDQERRSGDPRGYIA